MKKKFYIKADEIQLTGLKKDRLKPNSAWGKLNIGTNGFEIDSVLFTLEENGDIIQSYTSAYMRLLDVPVAHKTYKKNPPKFLSEETIGRAVCNEYLIRRKDELKAFIQKSNAGEIMDFPFFRPPEWKRPLRIPVEFIELSCFCCQQDGKILAHVQVGHHLIFFDIQIGYLKKFGCQTQKIKDARIVSAINDLLGKQRMQKYLKDLRARDWKAYTDVVDHVAEFTDKVRGCSPNAPPPRVRFY